jgi:hypothetical protein
LSNLQFEQRIELLGICNQPRCLYHSAS